MQGFERIAVIYQHLEGQNTKILSVERAARDNERAHIYQKNTMNEMRQMLLLALSYIELLSSSKSTSVTNSDGAKEVGMEVRTFPENSSKR